MKRLAVTYLLLCFCTILKAQLINSGQLIHVENGGLLYVDGDVRNNTGDFSLNGDLIVKGNWHNHSANGAFHPKSSGMVIFAGGNQTINGSKTGFPDLKLAGYGIKTLEADVDITGALFLEDKVLNIGNHHLIILNPAVGAIQRNLGFIATDGTGTLRRYTERVASYLFPIGSLKLNPSFTGFNEADVNPLYRPVSIQPENESSNSFEARLANQDPDFLYPRNQKRADVQYVSNKYYYILSQTTGLTKSTINFYQNTGIDLGSVAINWLEVPSLWERMFTSTQDGIFGDRLNKMLTINFLPGFLNLPVTFANSSVQGSPFTFFNAFSPDGDGRNDTWQIKNIEMFPNNTLTIFNRWGDEVYRAKGYSNSDAWNGGNLQSGTYFYVLQVNVEGNPTTFRGFITMMRRN